MVSANATAISKPFFRFAGPSFAARQEKGRLAAPHRFLLAYRAEPGRVIPGIESAIADRADFVHGRTSFADNRRPTHSATGS
jgi:hypothetical protein